MNYFFSPAPFERVTTSHRVALDALRTRRTRHICGHDAHGWCFVPPEHSVMILGPPRSGKTSSVIIPNVLAANGPVVSTSTKPDVLDATVGARSSLGQCLLFDPSGAVERSDGRRRCDGRLCSRATPGRALWPWPGHWSRWVRWPTRVLPDRRVARTGRNGPRPFWPLSSTPPHWTGPTCAPS